MSYQKMLNQLEHQRLHGVEMSGYADVDGRVKAIVCECGLYRRDQPPGVYVCGCGRNLNASLVRLMCGACSDKIVGGRSSYASYRACDKCSYRLSEELALRVWVIECADINVTMDEAGYLWHSMPATGSSRRAALTKLMGSALIALNEMGKIQYRASAESIVSSVTPEA